MGAVRRGFSGGKFQILNHLYLFIYRLCHLRGNRKRYDHNQNHKSFSITLGCRGTLEGKGSVSASLRIRNTNSSIIIMPVQKVMDGSGLSPQGWGQERKCVKL